MKICIDKAHDGRTVLDYIRYELRLSRTTLIMLKKRENGITLNSSHVTVRALLHKGDILELLTEDDRSEENPFIEPVELPIDVLYEDEYIVALNKPHNMPTHPSHNHHSDTLANALAFRYRSEPFVFRPVNRLDRDTSGVVLVAKNRISAHKFSELIAAHGSTKRYLALLDGEISPVSGMITGYIGRERESIITRILTDSPPGDYSETRYRTLARSDSCSLVLAEPITGRTHQLRVHFASRGNPIVGDTLYGAPDGSLLIARQALHAVSLSFVHPFTGEDLRISAPPPEDFRVALSRAKIPEVLSEGIAEC